MTTTARDSYISYDRREAALPSEGSTEGWRWMQSDICKGTGSQGKGYASDVLAGLKWIREHMQEYGIRIVNISVGSLSRRDMTENSILVRGVNAAWMMGWLW